MVNLNLNPEAILTLQPGEHCTVDGVEFVLESYPEMGEGNAFLTSVDSKVDLYNDLWADASFEDNEVPQYGQFIRHVRVGTFAVMSRAELHKALVENTYRIDDHELLTYPHCRRLREHAQREV